MNDFRIEITEPAENDRDVCFAYIFKRDPDGAIRWLNAFRDAYQALLIQPHYGEAPESRQHEETIRQKMFTTRRGRTYRFLYVIRNKTIYILHIRGPGQDVMAPDEVVLPDETDEEE